jgi:polysaccharide deacetylase 2 family uncharacterized protein YibQ
MPPKKRTTKAEATKGPRGGQFRGVLAKAAPAAGFLLITGLAIALFVQFLGDRPLNLRPHSNHVARALQQIFIDNNVPEENVVIAEAQPRKTADGSWNYHRFHVTVPGTVSLPGLQEVVRRYVVQQYEGGVSVTETEPGRLQLAFGEWILADVDFRAAAPPPKQDLTAATDRIAEDVGAILRETGIPETDLSWMPGAPREDEDAHWNTARARLKLASGVPVEEIAKTIEERMDGRDVTLRIETADHGDQIIRIAFAGKDTVDIAVIHAGDENLVSELPPLDVLPMESAEYADGEAPALLPEANGPVENPRIAIILDDGGYGGPATEAALALPHRITFAILPDTPQATEIAQRAAELGFEVMLHMPMAASGADTTPFPGQLTEDMDAETIKQRTGAAIAQIPGLAGVNNHTGSAFTSNAVAMRPFLEVIHELGLYFVDSFTTPDSVGLELALDMQIPALRRDVFLDNDPAPDAITAQVDKLIERARTAGYAIGIGHFRDSTLEVLDSLLERIQVAGIELVPVSELLP